MTSTTKYTAYVFNKGLYAETPKFMIINSRESSAKIICSTEKELLEKMDEFASRPNNYVSGGKAECYHGSSFNGPSVLSGYSFKVYRRGK